MRKGFILGTGIIAIGIVLQIYIGGMVWHSVAYPVNLCLLVLYLLLLYTAYVLRRKSRFITWSMTNKASVPAIIYTVLLTLLAGLIPQNTPSELQSDTFGLNHITSHPAFLLTYLWMTTILGLTAIKQVHTFKWRKVPSLLTHTGGFLTIMSATLGFADMQQLKMPIITGDTEWRAVDDNGKVHTLPFGIELQRFTIEKYPDGTPRRFASYLKITEQNGTTSETIIEVNHPSQVADWQIYQFDYTQANNESDNISVLELVRDPWLPIVYTGLSLLALGATLLLIKTFLQWRHKWILITLALLVITLMLIAHHHPHLYNKSLVPALQSHWFAPHIILYMAAYTMMGVSVIIWLCQIFSKHPASFTNLFDKVVNIGLPLLTLGMLIGTIWAKEAWGHYWTWDIKETWAAITWFAYLAYIHLRIGFPSKRHLSTTIMVISFLLLQMCWWGINYLPSITINSIHTYKMD